MKKFVLILCLVLCFGVIVGCTGDDDSGHGIIDGGPGQGIISENPGQGTIDENPGQGTIDENPGQGTIDDGPKIVNPIQNGGSYGFN